MTVVAKYIFLHSAYVIKYGTDNSFPAVALKSSLLKSGHSQVPK